MFDLWERVAESAEPRHRIIEAFLAGPVSILAFDEEDAKAATQIRAELDAKSGKVEPLGLLVAGQAQAKRLVLATAGVKWPRVKGLLCRDWAV
jgi:predicted nucleic acid-binding protein